MAIEDTMGGMTRLKPLLLSGVSTPTALHWPQKCLPVNQLAMSMKIIIKIS